MCLSLDKYTWVLEFDIKETMSFKEILAKHVVNNMNYTDKAKFIGNIIEHMDRDTKVKYIKELIDSYVEIYDNTVAHCAKCGLVVVDHYGLTCTNKDCPKYGKDVYW